MSAARTQGVLLGLLGLFLAACTAEPDADADAGAGGGGGHGGGAPVVLGTPGENCPGYESPTDGDGLCRLDADCHGGGACDVWPEIVSGIDSDATPIPPAHECADDADCTSNRCAG